MDLHLLEKERVTFPRAAAEEQIHFADGRRRVPLSADGSVVALSLGTRVGRSGSVARATCTLGRKSVSIDRSKGSRSSSSNSNRGGRGCPPVGEFAQQRAKGGLQYTQTPICTSIRSVCMHARNNPTHAHHATAGRNQNLI
jgi:hypothetical protein